MRAIVITILVLLAVTSTQAQYTIDDVLNSVEENNLSLAAKRKFQSAQVLEQKMENNLEDPKIEYVPFGGKGANFGKKFELSVVQEFDFPTVYAKRSRLAKIKAKQFGYEYAAQRQVLLLEAQKLCLEIQSLKEQAVYLKSNMKSAQLLDGFISDGFSRGDFNAMERNSAKLEYIAAKNAYQLNQINLTTALKQLTNLNGGKTIEFEGYQLEQMPILGSLEQLVENYLQTSPELMSLITEQQAANQEIKVSRSKSLPSFGLGYKHDYDPGERNHGLIVSASIPIFSNRNNVKRAKAVAAVAQAEVTRTRLDMETRLSQLYRKAEMINETVQEYNKIVNDSSLRPLEKAYLEGHISIMEYYNEVMPIYDACLELIAMRYQYHLTWAEINMVNL